MIKAVMNVEAPRQHVFTILTDYPNYTHWVPGCELCNVLSRSGNATDVNLSIASMKRIEMGLRFEAQPIQALNFRMVQGKDVKAYSGTYRLMDSADGKGTVVIAELEIDAGFMVPKFMVDKMTRKMMDETGVLLRKYMATLHLPTAAAPTEAPKPKEAKARRARRVVRVTKTATGYRVWLLGETYNVKSQGS